MSTLSILLPNRRFARHFVEMLVAMMAGMVVLGVPAVALLEALGGSTDRLADDAPAVLLVAMTVAMTAPMLAWMTHRGHPARLNAEMAAAMLLPTGAILALLWSGAMTDFGTLMMLEHTVMVPAMLAAMLLRRDEYSH